jgi:hypothetical protein
MSEERVWRTITGCSRISPHESHEERADERNAEHYMTDGELTRSV